MSDRPSFLHVPAGAASERVWTRAFREALAPLGELTIVEDGHALPLGELLERIRGADILFTCWGSSAVPEELAAGRGRLGCICNVTGSVRPWIPRMLIEAGIPVTNWGDAPAQRLAEGAMTLLLATLKDLPHQIELVRRDEWQADPRLYGGTLEGLNVGIYGLGAIGRRFVELLRPFRPVMRVYDPYVAELPPGCERVGTLRELFERSQAIVIHAGLSDETRGSITAELLALLPNHGIVVNTARGAIIEQAALFAELSTGRLRAGLDVLEPDRLPEGHPARHLDNLILTAHRIGRNPPDYYRERTWLDDYHLVCLDNVSRYLAGEPLRFRMDLDGYDHST